MCNPREKSEGEVRETRRANGRHEQIRWKPRDGQKLGVVAKPNYTPPSAVSKPRLEGPIVGGGLPSILPPTTAGPLKRKTHKRTSAYTHTHLCDTNLHHQSGLPQSKKKQPLIHQKVGSFRIMCHTTKTQKKSSFRISPWIIISFQPSTNINKFILI